MELLYIEKQPGEAIKKERKEYTCTCISLSQFIATELGLSKDQHGLILLMKVVIFLFQTVVKVVGLMEIEEVVEIVKVVGLMETEEVVEIVKVVEAVEAVG